MSKYFYDILNSKSRKISEYRNESNINQIDYLISIVGNIDMDEESINLFLSQFNRYGGKYDVRLESKTIIEMNNFKKKYMYLNAVALDEIWFRFIYDLFKKYSLLDALEEFFIKYGRNDETFEKYLSFVDEKSDELQLFYIDECTKLNKLVGIYSDGFICHLKQLILRKHILFEEIEQVLPFPQLVEQDEKQLLDLARKYRIFFGLGNPFSYSLIQIAICDRNLDNICDDFKYYIKFDNNVIEEKMTFTKNDFINSKNDLCKVLKKED